MDHTDSGWYCVRCVLKVDGDRDWLSEPPKEGAALYEERITLWQAESFDAAIELAEKEALEYAKEILEGEYVGFAQAYNLPATPGHGVEVYSLVRASELPTQAYIESFFDTGSERQGE